MKRICKIFAVLLVMAIALFSFSITAGATEVSNTQDGLVASITSEKDSYKSNEDIELTFKVTNTNDFAVENVSLEAIIPDGLTLKNNDNTTVNTVSLGSGESLELTLTAVKESSVITVPIGDSTEPNTQNPTQTQPVAAETTENTTVVQTDSIHATTTKANSATSDTVSTNGSDNTTIQTGKTISYLLVGLICLACLAVAVISFRFRKKTVKYLSLVLCVCIAVGSVAFVGVTNTMAQETTQQMSFEVSKIITVDNEYYTIQSSLIYDKIVEENDNDYENFEKVQQTTVDIEKKYLNSDGYVDYEDTQKLFEEITGYLQTQKDLGIIDYFTQGSSSIFVKMKSGINYMYIPEYKDYLSSGSEHRIITFEPVKSSFEYKFEKFYADFYIDFGSLCLGTENLDTDLIENAELLGKESEYKYSSEDSYIDEEVTINKLLNLSPNSLILFEGHGGYSEETGSVLWTDEKVNDNVTYNFGEDAIVYSKDKTIGVTYQFFEKLQNNSLENSTIYLGACCSAKDERLANSLIDKGAENVLGYSDIVGIRYEIGLRTFLLYGLTLNHDNGDAYTLEEAYNFALSTYGTKDSREPYAYLKILQREHYGTLSASVISSDNTPISDVRVDAYLKVESGTQYVGNTYTDDKGNFSMELQSGSYELRFNKDGYKTATTTIKISKDVMTVLKDPVVMEKEISYNIKELGALIKQEASMNNGNIALKLWVPEDSLELTKKQVSEFENLFKDYADLQIKVIGASKADAATMAIYDRYSAADVYNFAGNFTHELLSKSNLAKVIFSEEVISTNTPESLSTISNNNQLFAYPLTNSQTYILCYNKSVISDSDIKSLENIMSACKASNKKFGTDASNAFSNSMFLFTGGLEPMGFEKDGYTQKFNDYDIDEVTSSVYAFANLFKKYEPYFENNSSENLVKQLGDGTVAAGFIGSWDISKAQTVLGKNAGFSILPTINIDGKDTQIKCFFEYDYLGVNSCSDFPVSSQILAYYLSNSNSQQVRAEKLNLSPTNINVIASDYVKKHSALTSIVNQSHNSINYNAISHTFWPPCEYEIGKYITDFTNDFSYNAIKSQVQNTIINILDA